MPAPPWPTTALVRVEEREKAQTALALLFDGPSYGDPDRFVAEGHGNSEQEVMEKFMTEEVAAALRTQARIAGYREQRTAALYAMSRELAAIEAILAGEFTQDAGAVTVDALGDREFSGTVAHVAPGVDPLTRTARVRVRLANPAGLFW